jgi:hypothetical protein
MENGTVTASHSSSAEGDFIWLRAEAFENYAAVGPKTVVAAHISRDSAATLRDELTRLIEEIDADPIGTEGDNDE